MVLTGYALKVVGDLAPELVIAPELAASGDPAELAAGCLAAVDVGLAEQAREGDILVLDGAVADGPGAEAAVLALQALGVAAIVCRGAGPEFVTQAGLYGLPVLAQPDAVAIIPMAALLRLDLERGLVEARETDRWQATPCPADVLAATRRAQLLARMRRVVEDEGYAE